MNMSYNKKQHEPKRGVETKNFNLKKEYKGNIEYNKFHFTSTVKNGVMYCIDKYKPDVIFAMLV